MTLGKIAAAVSTAVVVIACACSIFIISEGESALKLRLGQIVSDDNIPEILKPGMHLKVPFIDHVRIFDTRMQQLATPTSQPLVVVTKEQTYLVVAYFAKWRINNLATFYTSTSGSINYAETLLEQRINDVVRAEYGKRTSDQAISTDRTNMMKVIKDQANNIAKDQGIQVLDVQIQQITLPKDVMDSVFKRMAAERKQFAEAKRAEGLEKSEEVRALADQKVTVIKAEAVMRAASVRAQGDQQAAEIFAKAYSADPHFYSFYRSLEAYTKSFNKKSDMLVLKPDGQFFNYFHNMNSQGGSLPAKAIKR